MSSSPLVSIIIPTYNHAAFLREALQSVRAQTFTDWEAVVVNNYSQDETVGVVESFAEPRIRLENFNNNGVIAAARNRGIALARGKYLAFLDSDDIWYPEKLTCCIARIEEGHDLICHGLHWFGNRREQDKFYGPADRASFESLLYQGNCIATSATVVKKELVEAVGGFSESPEIVTAEDYHLWLKLAKNGANIGFVHQILGRYRFHSANTGTAMRQSLAVRHVVEEFFPDEKLRSLRDWVRVCFRYGIIEYANGRCLQSNEQFPDAWPFLLRALIYHPFYAKTYAAIALNVFAINIDK